MLDHLRIKIPVFEIYTKQYSDRHFYFDVDLKHLDIDLSARSVTYDESGNMSVHDLYAPYTSLSSGFSDMAVKFFDNGINSLPYLEIKASPIKLHQGHNIFGYESILIGANLMLSLVLQNFPKLSNFLDFSSAEVLHIDITYNFNLGTQSLVKKALNYLSNISVGHAKANNLAYSNYVRWGKHNSRSLGRKVYGKFEEVQQQMQSLKSSKSLDVAVLNKYKALTENLKFAEGRLRFESRITKHYFTKHGISTKLTDLIKIQESDPLFMYNLWSKTFNPILSALESDFMLDMSNENVEKTLRSIYFSVKKNGDISYVKADRLLNFYLSLKTFGYDHIKSKTTKSIFYSDVKKLVDAGISKAELQNLKGEDKEIVPFRQLVVMKPELAPEFYKEPVEPILPFLQVA